jgi:hypothetical protein
VTRLLVRPGKDVNYVGEGRRGRRLGAGEDADNSGGGQVLTSRGGLVAATAARFREGSRVLRDFVGFRRLWLPRLMLGHENFAVGPHL